MRFIVRPHSCRYPHGTHLGCWFLFPPPPPLLGAPLLADYLPTTGLAREIGRIRSMYLPNSRSTSIGLRDKGELDPSASTTSKSNTATHLLSYWLYLRDTL